MNFTYLLYCDCGFNKSLSEGESHTILQCQNCYRLESKEKKMTYFITCLVCGEKEDLGEGFSFETSGQQVCKNCSINGKVSLSEGEGVAFIVDSDYESMDACSHCKETEWNPLAEDELKCPACLRPVQQKMSNYWE